MWLPTLAMLCKSVGLVAGFLWPGYASYKALEGRGTEAPAVWLTYWVVFSLLTVLTAILDPVVGSWMPFYYPLQLALVLWLMLPQTRGANTVYSQVLLPLLSQHEVAIDQALETSRRRTEELTSRLLPKNGAPRPGDQEEGSGALFREWDFSQSLPDRQARLRERPAGSYSSLYNSSLSASVGVSQPEDSPSRPEKASERLSFKGAATPVPGGTQEDGVSEGHAKDK
mmetsp:Transcript_29377/g.82847  ORF Transcript_29377/g.82847 Transcript_29377/m.82847 type:complete len:227 (+) Transcript_29377:267-947(+)|eukprot:CAMPEP_0117680044 /NCGR_PEP_ID=MMETSP0804-20121206/18129_1 /TAXON_ID=1074897 /ORGANISM="Tetraselmis astigmatica, Strain CCMP880" /LENGTH=226 /DNA_ID=CAMNT_0005489489 /DNA_START=253 /DNA_END=933 /DNA_ORIENTATION=+